MATKPIVQLMLLLFAALLLIGCQAPQPSPGDPPKVQGLEYLRAVGDAVVRVDGTAALRKYAPEAIAILDQPARDATGAITAPPDGVITLGEIEAVVLAAADPEQLVWLALMVRALIDARG